MMDIESSIARYSKDLEQLFSGRKAVIFLCGPSINNIESPGVKLRKELEAALKGEGFEVVLSEELILRKLSQLRSFYENRSAAYRDEG